jgi:hypothetical protein
MSAALISEASVGFDHRQDAGADRLVRLRKESRKNSWPLIVDINCDLRYLKHPQFQTISRGGLRIVDGTRDGTQSVSRPYLTPYIKLERIGWGRVFA